MFGGAGIGAWSWTYTGPACPVLSHGQILISQETWTGASTNGGGQSNTAGNITGACKL